VSQGRVAASGGYWISMEGDSIMVSPFTITGSIGVIGGWFWNEGLGKKLGLTSDRVKVGQSADLLGGLTVPFVGVTLPERNFDARERGLIKENILGSYDDFTRKVAAARKLDVAYVREIGEGHVYSGRVGIEKRIVDRVATLEETIESAKRAAGIKPGREVRVVEFPKQPLFRLPSFMPSFVRSRVERAVASLPGARRVDEPLARFFPRTYEGRGMEFLFKNPGRPLFLVPGSLLPDEEPVQH
jgi:protease-4